MPAKNHFAAYSGATRSRHTRARGAWIDTQSTPWNVASAVSERERTRAAQGSAWARAKPGRRQAARKIAKNGALEGCHGRAYKLAFRPARRPRAERASLVGSGEDFSEVTE